jgi:uncharacterized Zn-binding protein involved in type VI secretion
VWWACACAHHTAASGTDPSAEAKVREAAEEWVRKQTDEHRRTAMEQAETTGFGSPEAWAAVGAFWSGDSMAPPEALKVPPQPHFTGLAVASVALAAARGRRCGARRNIALASARTSARAAPAGQTMGARSPCRRHACLPMVTAWCRMSMAGLPPGCLTVLIGGMPAARVGDMAVCVSRPCHRPSSFTVLVGGMPAQLGSMCAHGAVVIGCPVIIG